jgi:peptidoglycan/xylan/chitin deacetylase (PgdA/CDA1 family)
MRPSSKKLTLSFDNGPSADVTPDVLEALRERDLRASFFVRGIDAEDRAKRAILERASDAGHRIGNHTQTHTIQLGSTNDPQIVADEIGLAQEALGDLSEPERWFRPYGGGGIIGPNLLSQAAVDFIAAGHYSVVLWNSVPRDWLDPQGWPEIALAHAREQDWTLLVIHDTPTGAMLALPKFLDDVIAEGIEIVQDFPPECVPILRGKPVLPIDHIVSEAR